MVVFVFVFVSGKGLERRHVGRRKTKDRTPGRQGIRTDIRTEVGM